VNAKILSTLVIVLFLSYGVFAGGQRQEVFETGPREGADTQSGIAVAVQVMPGEHFDHKMKIFPLINITNNPQMVLWAESAEGDFLGTLYITERIATQSWRGAPGDDTPKEEIRRPESLPVWAHRHGEVYSDGLLVPTREEPMADAVTGATPKGEFLVYTEIPAGHGEVLVYLEVNMSTDFNDAFPAEAPEGSPNYSGGEWGSGQPALVYRGRLVIGDGGRPRLPVELTLLGRSSPDGSTGEIFADLEGMTTAQEIVSAARLVPAGER
jgi:hypothetical protein